MKKDDKIIIGFYLVIVIVIISVGYVSTHAIDNIAKACNDVEEFPEECYFEGVVTYPPEHQGKATCICLDYAFLGEEYEYVEIQKKEINVKGSIWFKLLKFI